MVLVSSRGVAHAGLADVGKGILGIFELCISDHT